MTRAGRVSLVVRLPEDLRELRFVPLRGTGKVIARDFTLTPLGELSRRAWMAAWAAHDLWKFRGSAACSRVGLSWRRLATDLEGAYAASGKLRVHAPPMGEDERAAEEQRAAEASFAETLCALGTQAPQVTRTITVLVDARHADEGELARVTDALAGVRCPWQLETRIAREHLGAERRASLGRSAVVVVVDAHHGAPAEGAVHWLAAELFAKPELRLVTVDALGLGPDAGRTIRIRRAEEWNEEGVCESAFVGAMVAVRGDLFADGRDDVPVDPGPLAAAFHAMRDARTGAHRHLPHPLERLHRDLDSRSDAARDAAFAVVSERGRRGAAFAVAKGLARNALRIDYPLPQGTPKVTAIVPTRDAPAVLATCIDSVLAKTGYPNFELVVVDNGTRDRDALAYLHGLETRGAARVIRDDSPFNYSALNNRATRETQGDLLAFLNNDLEVLDDEWLGAMVRHAIRPVVGAVGAKLLYPDGFVQHAGVVVDDDGNPDHAFRLYPGDHTGPELRLLTAQRCTAVTGACLVVRREAFERVGGFDAEHLAIAFNDVDLCFKLRALGLVNVWTPHACLVHHESYSRGDDNASSSARARATREGRTLAERWKLQR